MKKWLAVLALCASLVVGGMPKAAEAIATPAPVATYCAPPSPLPTTGAGINAPPLVADFKHAETCGGQVGDIYTDGPLFNPSFTWGGGSLSFTIPLNTWYILGNRTYIAGVSETAPPSTTSYWWVDNSTMPGTIMQTSSNVAPTSTSILAYTIVTNSTGITSVTYTDTASITPVYASLVLLGTASLQGLTLTTTPLGIASGGTGTATPSPSVSAPIEQTGTFPNQHYSCSTCGIVQPTASPSPQAGSIAVTQKIAGGNVNAAPVAYSGDTSQEQIGDLLAAESSTVGRVWLGKAPTGHAVATVYVGLAQFQAAPHVGDILTVTVNGTAVPYTVTSSDTNLATLDTDVASAIQASSVSSIATAAAVTGGVSITAVAGGFTGRYSLAVSLSGGSKETLAARPKLDIPGNYLDYFGFVNGFTFSTDLGNYTFDDTGNLIGPVATDLNISSGPGAPSHGVVFNKNAAGNNGGLLIYDGTTNIGASIVPFDQSTFTGPLYASECPVTSSHCTSAPAHPGYVGPWLNTDGTVTQGTQHQTLALCSSPNVVCAANLMTITFTVPWTSTTSYGCTVTSEYLIATPPYIDTKTTTEIEFTFPSVVTAADAICTGY